MPQVNALLEEDELLKVGKLLQSYVINEEQVDGALMVKISNIFSLLGGHEPNVVGLRQLLDDQRRALRRDYLAAEYRKENPQQEKLKLIYDLMRQIKQVITDERVIDDEAYHYVDEIYHQQPECLLTYPNNEKLKNTLFKLKVDDGSLSQITDQKMNFFGRTMLQVEDQLHQSEGGKVTTYSNLKTGKTVEKTILLDLGIRLKNMSIAKLRNEKIYFAGGYSNK